MSLVKIGRRWIITGVCTALIFSILYTSFYGYFYRGARERHINPIENEENIKWLYENSFLLYRELYQKQSASQISYMDLYLSVSDNYQWIRDYMNQETRKVGEPPENLPDVVDTYAYELVMEAYNKYQDRFRNMEEHFDSINKCYDYWIQDHTTGTVITNLPQDQKPNASNALFYLTYVFDEKGSVTLGNVFCGEDASDIRKSAMEAARNNGLTEISTICNENYYDNLFTLSAPRNCTVIYQIDNEAWENLYRTNSGNQILIYDGSDYREVNTYPNYYDYINTGCGAFLSVLALLIFLTGVFLPFYKANNVHAIGDKICRLPLEVLGIFGFIWFAAGLSLSVETVTVVAGRRMTTILMDNGWPGFLSYTLTGLFNFVVLGIFLFGFWFIGVSIRDIRDDGILCFIKRRSLIYRFFPFLKSKALACYQAILHFDLTQNANKMILRVVIINGIILFLICSIWVAGMPIAVVYSIVLYVLLRRYVSDLQKKYRLLLSVTNRIAEGNLNVAVTEDLGVFEPFKPELVKIQNGFSKAVEEEVKSQRMRVELITNVSHDLKTPLTAIITYVDLLKNGNATEEQRAEYLNTLERKSLRLKALIEDLFEVSKADSRSMTVNLQPVDLGSLIKQVVFELEDRFNDAELELRMRMPEEKVLLELDSQKTYRIYENLLNNVAKYAMHGTRVYIEGDVTEKGFLLTIKNISAQELSIKPGELKERFVRGDASRNTEGSGLGLAIAESFTSLQGGKLTLEVDGDLFKASTLWPYDAKNQSLS